MQAHDFLLVGVVNQLRFIVDAELAHQVEFVGFDRFGAHIQGDGAFLDGHSFGEQLQDFAFAGGEDAGGVASGSFSHAPAVDEASEGGCGEIFRRGRPGEPR